MTERTLPRILLIDDDPISREVLTAVLESHGFPVTGTEDGNAALQAIASAASVPEVILMDTQMPGISGVKLIRALRQAAKTRVIAISASEVSEEILAVADGFLLKPIEPKRLMTLLALDSEARTPTPPVVPTGASTLIDPVILANFKAMMPPEAIEEIYVAVAADLAKRLPLLEAATISGNAAEGHRIAHAIKGGCAMVGLTEAAQAASRLEKTGGGRTFVAAAQKELLHLRETLSTLQGILEDKLLK